ncbi:MAG: anacyclamide/piricyclamide family prenylated cyclic peptide [Hormoscilla sp. GUM202]|nr:anacyclamide/piricyclamide family prenylated cyclic peptide [Hormoscilla sp. GUM202]
MKKKTLQPQLAAPVQRTTTATSSAAVAGGVLPAERGLFFPECSFPFAGDAAK